MHKAAHGIYILGETSKKQIHEKNMFVGCSMLNGAKCNCNIK